ncbi:hypothetical protein O1611_g9709 [Lasiodiplodia mahajangana]|uniref:Uncharacterized protein n=1 Tax=Lasiodiplodia mahajangana TaxID=1108764 RepID=A0ACC2J688_9PEZI|nr:hypothetical protein O1611_g9709 [Lasiodiplodia mahajangana]
MRQIQSKSMKCDRGDDTTYAAGGDGLRQMRLRDDATLLVDKSTYPGTAVTGMESDTSGALQRSTRLGWHLRTAFQVAIGQLGQVPAQ